MEGGIAGNDLLGLLYVIVIVCLFIALVYAWSKQKGRNQVSLTSELNIDSREFIDIDGEHEILSTIQALAATVDAKDPNTFGHSQKTSEYSVYVAKALGYTNDKIAILRAAALLHDIGKLRISDGILRKPGPLDDE